MWKSAPARSALVGLGLIALVLLLGISFSSFSSASTREKNNDLVVHEWGTFTSVSGHDGSALFWRPFKVESDLPSFVYSVDSGNTWRGLRYPSKSGMAVRVRMETPVLYFYSQNEMSVAIKVSFPSGRITEWYPTAKVNAGDITWSDVRLMPGAQLYFPNDFSQNHYYPARETDAASLQVRRGEETEQERFLFYRGVGDFALPLSAKLDGDKVVVTNVGGERVRKLVLFENRNGKIGYRMTELNSAEATVNRPQLNGDLGGLRNELKSLLMNEGLFEKEAEAMLNTWRNSWFEEGLRAFYLMPRKTTDAVLPIDVSPQPNTLVRVLVGRTELVTPEMENNVTAQVTSLSDPSAIVQQTALKAINRYGRFTESILTQVLLHTRDPQVKAGVERLLAKEE
jgi:hypothetical protein